MRLVVAAALLAFVFSRVPLASVTAAASGADRGLLLAAFAATLGGQLIASARLRLALASQGVGVSLWAVFQINLAARFYNLFIPGGTLTGMAVRVLKVTRLRRGVAAAGTAVLADRLVVTLVLCVLGMAFWLTQRPAPEPVWLGVFAACAVALALGLGMLLRPRALAGLRAIVPKRLRTRWASVFRSAAERAVQLRGPVVAIMLVLALATHLAGIACYWLVLSSLDLGPTALDAGWVRSVLLLITLVPISLAGLGVREAGAYLVLQAYGVDASTAVTFSLLVALVSVIGTGLLGGVLEAAGFARRSGSSASVRE